MKRKYQRDLTKTQFQAALKRHGFDPSIGFLGYCEVTHGLAKGLCISTLHAGPIRRAQLAYLIREKQKWEQKKIGKVTP